MRLLGFLVLLGSLCAVSISFSNSKSERQFVHSVYFWLKEDVTEAQKAEFIEIIKSLDAVSTVRDILVGVPAGTDRPVVDNTYDVSLIIKFRDKAGHDAYQVDQLHLDAVSRFKDKVDKFIVYDVLAE